MAEKTRHIGFYVDEDLRARIDKVPYGVLSDMMRTLLERAMDLAEKRDDEFVYMLLADGRFEYKLNDKIGR